MRARACVCKPPCVSHSLHIHADVSLRVYCSCVDACVSVDLWECECTCACTSVSPCLRACVYVAVSLFCQSLHVWVRAHLCFCEAKWIGGTCGHGEGADFSAHACHGLTMHGLGLAMLGGDQRGRPELPPGTCLTPSPACRRGDTRLRAVRGLGTCYLLERARESRRLGEMRRVVALGRLWAPSWGILAPTQAASLQGPQKSLILVLGTKTPPTCPCDQ